jgi:hypothetical protein
VTEGGKDYGERLATIEAELRPLKEGVANFREFQDEARVFFGDTRDFIREATVRADEQKKQQEQVARALIAREKKADHWWKRIVASVVIMGGIASLLNYFSPPIRALLIHWLQMTGR